MNREMRRLMEREERRQKKQKDGGGGRGGRGTGGPGGGRGPGGRPSQPGEKVSLWRRLVQFLHEVRVEMRKVSWPTREQMVAFTTVTLITSVALTLVVFGLDIVLKEAVLVVIGGASG